MSENKKAQLPQWVTGPQPSVYGINGNKLRQKNSKQNKDTGRDKLPLLDVPRRARDGGGFSPTVNPLKMG